MRSPPIVLLWALPTSRANRWLQAPTLDVSIMEAMQASPPRKPLAAANNAHQQPLQPANGQQGVGGQDDDSPPAQPVKRPLF